MKIGIVGAGHIGGTLAILFTRAGHEVALANSRDPGTLADTVAALGPNAHAATAADAAAFGELVAIAVPLRAYSALPPEPFAGKIVVDANNYYPQRDGQIAELDSKSATSTGLLARHLPDARAKAVLTGLIDEIGFSAVDTGTLAESWRQEPDAPVYGAEVQPGQAVALIARAHR